MSLPLRYPQTPLKTNRFVHGDVEPTNVMFTTKRAWHVKLIDFGRARLIGSRNGLAGDGQLLEEWTAPEVLLLTTKKTSNGLENNSAKNIEDQSILANQQSDMWGLGLITFLSVSFGLE